MGCVFEICQNYQDAGGTARILETRVTNPQGLYQVEGENNIVLNIVELRRDNAGWISF
jgi:hypothetical protein